MRQLHVKALVPEKVRQAFALVRAITPQVSIDEWARCAQWFLSPGPTPRGILCIENEQGYLTGLCCYRLADFVGQGRTAVVDRVIALDLIDPSQIAGVLIGAVESRAEQLGCETVQVTLFRTRAGREPPGLISVLQGCGYRRAAKTMVKLLHHQRAERHCQTKMA